ncbi:hypothetical protein [Aromatoleum toluvorans]
MSPSFPRVPPRCREPPASLSWRQPGRSGSRRLRAPMRRPAVLFTVPIMDLTKNFVKAKRPCTNGFRWFLRHYENGGNYQELLDALVKAGRVDDACWLLSQFGPTDAVLEIDALDADAVVFAGTIAVRGSVDVDTVLRAGRAVHVGGSVRAGRTIVAGEEIVAGAQIRSDGTLQAGGDIKAGWGIEAHGDVTGGGDIRAAWDLLSEGAVTLSGNAFAGQDLAAQGSIQCGKSLHAGGNIDGADCVRADNGILAGGTIRCAAHLEAGWGIRAGQGIIAEGAIRVGESLQAGEEILAGPGYGIYAGLNVRVDVWETSARVCAIQKPDGLMSGWWSGAGPG